MSAAHRWPVRVYYEDTDLAGIVYYANYLRFIERARTEMLRAAGFDQDAMRADPGLVFAVRKVDADYLAPARFDDMLKVTTEVLRVSGARIVLRQSVARTGEKALFTAEVTLVALDNQGRAARVPADIRREFG
ncbi:tol-pal system-associated acyl-CoA thioesterase [Brevirhabdus pacifica]|uniref:Tol-pal system-associated acyl-CoA thioesterase n=1 Tax=Brevirhabdus pacifica TaxID=1267768 RepID=A0A1U7DHF3_9RHOB|nr:tol-pal system-associated acyl-CoA thioesterase [Brevirhabdus pacifica]APX89391.1 tol-pal system-associated acyl-CoA thioesterase [Brevirhabdus pacifica]OWU76583.1 thioesterase [Loktanella sp. 22II-4b]PJJ85971.1 acyl-CoA thioester hydrolase [Brevirhabdus pacifica]